MRLYVAGPMRNYPLFNFPAFYHAAAVLRGKGHEVYNPAEVDLADWESIEAVMLAYERDPLGVARLCLGRDMAWICAHADGIVLLPGWRGSTGANAELALARAIGLKVYYMAQDELSEELGA